MIDKYKGKYPKAWSVAEIETYKASGREPAKASNGVWLGDVRREAKSLANWSVAELFALYNNELVSQYSAGDDDFVSALLLKAKLKCPDAQKWSVDELYAWLATGKEPEKTPAGNYVGDPTRWEKDVNLWNDSELIDFGLGYFGDYERSRDYALVEAVRRFNLPTGITFEDYATYCATNVKPATTPDGLLINDRTRAGRPVAEWSQTELHAWVLGLITTTEHDEKELLEAVMLDVKAEWYWTKSDVVRFIQEQVIPEPDLVDVSDFSALELRSFILDVPGCDAAIEKAATLYLAKVERKPLAPQDFARGVPSGVVASQWTDAEIVDYAKTGHTPDALDDQLWLVDVTRQSRIPNQLAEVERKAAYYKRLPVTPEERQAILDVAIADLRDNCVSDVRELYAEDLLALRFDKKQPKRTETGVLVLSQTRDNTPLEKLSDDDLRGLTMGTLESKTPRVGKEAEILKRASEWKGLADPSVIVQWWLTQTGPDLTPNGVVIEDPRRCTESIDRWTELELVALAHGWIKGLDNVSEEALIAVMAAKSVIPSADWTLQEAVAYIDQGTLPEKTSLGTEKLRYDNMTITRKSDLGFFASWAKGEIKLPNDKAQVLNRVRALLKANSSSDDELFSFLKEYTGQASHLEPLKLSEKVALGDGLALKAAIDQWALSPGLSEVEVLKFFNGAEVGTFTTNEVLVDDARRDMKAAYKWSNEELIAWAKGEIPPTTAATFNTLVTALRNRNSSINPGWTDAQVRQYIATDEMPPKTSFGVWVTDSVRDQKYPSDWSDDELKSYVAGELVTTAPEVDVKLSLRGRFKVPTGYSDTQAAKYVLTGEIPATDAYEAFTNPLAVTNDHLRAWLEGEFEVAAHVAGPAMKEARSRFKINVHWVDKDVFTFYRTGVMPQGTSNGILINDRLRNLTDVSTWSYKEVQAFAMGEIQAPTVALRGAAFIARIRLLISVEKAQQTDKWSAEQLLTYLKTGERPALVAGNVNPADPTRLSKEAVQWTKDELKAWLRGDIPATDKAPENALWDIVYLRFEVPAPWYHEDARSYVLTGVTVPQLPSGIWVRDRERDSRTAWTWTRSEVKAWARGQILPGVNASEKHLVEQATYCFNIPTALSDEKIKSLAAGITEDTTPMTVSFVREDLLSFAEGMKKEGANEYQAALYLTMLHRCITRVTNLKGQDFVDGWTELLKFYFDHKGTLFNEKKLYFGVAMMSISPKQQKVFQYMTTLLFNTCDPATRDAIVNKNVDWVLALKDLATEDQRHALLAFYNVG